MRGQVGKRLTHYKLPRITPADAGTRAVKRTFCFSFRDHPRGCGDKCQVRERSYLQQGSPPRMRGQVSIYLSVTIWSGITPADAGTSVICSKQPRLAWDHPRGCGDKMVCSFFCVCLTDHPRGCGDKLSLVRYCPAVVGSPPRMRGQEYYRTEQRLLYGITPADAGTSSYHWAGRNLMGDHPRGCGDK